MHHVYMFIWLLRGRNLKTNCVHVFFTSFILLFFIHSTLNAEARNQKNIEYKVLIGYQRMHFLLKARSHQYISSIHL